MSLNPELKAKIDQHVKDNPVLVFMKGTKDFPQCGFSARVVQVFNQLGVDFTDVNVLEDNDIREGIKVYSDWPTIPQLYINGEFVGGCDITVEMFVSGELKQMLDNLPQQ